VLPTDLVWSCRCVTSLLRWDDAELMVYQGSGKLILQARRKRGQTIGGLVYGDGKSDPPPYLRERRYGSDLSRAIKSVDLSVMAWFRHLRDPVSILDPKRRLMVTTFSSVWRLPEV
jgi:hypothetical protein